MRTTHIVTACAVLAALGGAATDTAAQTPEDRREIRRFALAEPGSASIGVRVRELSEEEARKGHLPGGAAVADVVEGSPAAKAGFKAGDIVLEFDGERVRSARQFARLVEDTPEGRAVKTFVSRAGTKQTLKVSPVSRQADLAWMDDLGPRMRDGMERGMQGLRRGLRDLELDLSVESGVAQGGRRARLGVGVEPLSDQLAAYFGVKAGVLVASVEADSPAANAGLKAGDVITAVNGRAVSNPGELTAAVREAGGGATLTLDIVRDKKAQTLKATLSESPHRDPREDRLTARVF